MEIPTAICDGRQQVHKLACDRLLKLMWWCQAASHHMLDGSEQPKRAVAVVIRPRRHSQRKPTQENRHTRTWTPKKTHLAASVDQMAILPWVRQHSLACGANNRIHSAVSPRHCLQSSLPSLHAYDSWPRGRGKLGVKVVGGLKGGREWCCHWRSQDDNMIAGFELSLPNPQQH